MAYVDYNTFVETEKTSGNSDGIGFFTLKDGEEAIVRIMCDSINELDILTVHPITVGNSTFPNRQVNCLRDPREPLEQCPLCSAGNKVKQKVFIKMIKYDPTTGEPSPVVWDRPAYKLVPTIKKYIDEYGPLSNIICKIARTGSKYDTVYNIIPNINPSINCVRVDNAFENFNVLGRMVYDKNAQEMITFMQTGNFPQTNNSNTTNQPVNNNPNYSQPQVQNNGYEPVNTNNINQSVGGMPVNQPVDTTIPPINSGGSPTTVADSPHQNIPSGVGGLQRPERYF